MRPPTATQQKNRPLSPPLQRRRARLIALIALLDVLYLGILYLLFEATSAGPEHWWWSTVNLYLPQWLWGIPALMLALLTFFASRRAAWVQLLPLCWVAGPMMGWNWGADAPPPSELDGTRLRVMTYNIANAGGDAVAISQTIRSERPDLLLLQEVGTGRLQGVLEVLFPDWQIRSVGEFIVVSRLPLVSVKQYPLPSLGSEPWKSPSYLRCVVRAGKGDFALYNVHLSTPRSALTALRSGEAGAVSRLESDTLTRLHQASLVSERLRSEPGPALVAGDLNAPPPSMIVHQIRGAGLRDAFSEGGSGYGYTVGHALRFGQSFVRIDHILPSRHWRVDRCWTGSASGSDHRPLIAELFLPASATTPAAVSPSPATAQK